MSNQQNDSLLEEAQDYIDSGDLSSTPLEEMLERDIKTGDLESLWHHVIEARAMLRDDELEQTDVY